MIDNYYYKDYSDQYSREKIICLIDNDIKKKMGGYIKSTSGDLFIADVTIFYFFDTAQHLKFDYGFSDKVPISVRKFWEQRINVLEHPWLN